MGSREGMLYNLSDIKLQNIEKINNFILSMAQNETFFYYSIYFIIMWLSST